MSRRGRNMCWLQYALFILILVLSRSLTVWCVEGGDYSQTSNPALLPVATELIYGRISNLTSMFFRESFDQLGFCVKDSDADWDASFNLKNNLDFLTNCIRKTKGDITRRLCTIAETKFYFSSLFDSLQSTSRVLRLNRNCNLSSWVSGCEPGWGCSISQSEGVDLKYSKDIPARTSDCQPCCEGFFCPAGITCMIPCPLGSYCPLSHLNKTTGVCEPYAYQLPPGEPNHTCGGADVWADVTTSSEIFCSAGSYCPATTQKVPCSSGHYCRTGSTAEKSCFKLTSCPANTENQNIHAYGIILLAINPAGVLSSGNCHTSLIRLMYLVVGNQFLGISYIHSTHHHAHSQSFAFCSFSDVDEAEEAVLITILLIVHNCSDKVLSTRERRQAKKREEAATKARETAQARERWKSAKDVAKKGAMGLHQQLSRTFTRRQSSKQPDSQKSLGLPVPPPGTSGQSSTSKAKQKEPSALAKMMRAIDDDPESQEGFNMKIGDKNIKKQKPPKAKQLHTHSQIFNYAYDQLEKEKAQQDKNLTFTGLIQMAKEYETRIRPAIEVAFKDLTLTLKGKNKHLMRCVTGKIMPGRVSAVMGPSGAGKTTFLSALAGKTKGCTMAGSILINGKPESIHSYKRITGFVPQDDIVHGNLTVEENLRFSARCRLPANLPKPDKVLIIERVIEFLGLQAVRDSLVGTVEKRGISGGQRKRVNVGIEMVMEPSLLILDEPTSGLDSSSSQLLLRALRREALEGVNICMVVHQPSYALFQMFDDLILLAKGGLTVYHGPVKMVEEYFAGLGINVPERVNPPDHFIDILEGIVKPTSGITHEQLPVRWMLHNEYQVPADMLHLVGGVGPSSTLHAGNEATFHSELSFFGEMWHDIKINLGIKRDDLHHNFLKSDDLSNRVTPGAGRQYRYFLGRVVKQRLRDSRVQVVDFLILLLAGACLGTLAKVSDETFGALGYTYTVIAISLLSKIAALRSFSPDKLIYWRESSAGMSSLAYFLSKDTIDNLSTLIKPLVYLSMFYFFNNPRSSFADNYVVLLCLVYCVTGIAYILAVSLEPGPAQLWSVLLPVVLTLITYQDKDSAIARHIGHLCYTKWAVEAFVVANAERYSGVWLLTRCGSLMQSGYDLHDWTRCLILLMATGVVSRIVAFFCMVTFQRK